MRPPRPADVQERIDRLGQRGKAVADVEDDEIFHRAEERPIRVRQQRDGLPQRRPQISGVAGGAVDHVVLVPDVQHPPVAAVEDHGRFVPDIQAVGEPAAGQRVGKAGLDVGIAATKAVAGDQHVLGGQPVGHGIVAQRGQHRLHRGGHLARVELQVVGQVYRRVGAQIADRDPGQRAAGVTLLHDPQLGAGIGEPGYRAFQHQVAVQVDPVLQAQGRGVGLRPALGQAQRNLAAGHRAGADQPGDPLERPPPTGRP